MADKKTDRVKTVKTEVVGATIVWTRLDTEGEFGRLDVSALTPDMLRACALYGAKQVVADVVGTPANMDERVTRMKTAIASIGSGAWPRREAAEISPETAMLALAAKMGKSIEEVRAMLGM